MNKKTSKTCLNCIYYHITWDKSFPYGCKGFGFKSRKIPCDEVKESSHEECKMYKSKIK